jgi:hypothetical protein
VSVKRERELEEVLEKAGLWMGWGTVPDLEGREMGGENEGGVSRFGIFVMWDKGTCIEQESPGEDR